MSKRTHRCTPRGTCFFVAYIGNSYFNFELKKQNMIVIHPSPATHHQRQKRLVVKAQLRILSGYRLG